MNTILFEPWADVDKLNEDVAVVTHELGHASAWFTLGHAVGRLRFERATDRLLHASCIFGPYAQEVKESDEYLEALAERLLSAESAVRRLLGLRRDRIFMSLADEVSRETVHSILARLDQHEDITTVLSIADQVAGTNWQSWIQDRLERAKVIVDKNWDAIAHITERMSRRVPRKVGCSATIWGFELLREFRKAGISCSTQQCIEILSNQAKLT